jgi:hypothetical protein
MTQRFITPSPCRIWFVYIRSLHYSLFATKFKKNPGQRVLQGKERKTIDAQLEELQEKPTQYEPFVFSKYRLAAKAGFPNGAFYVRLPG